MAKTTLNNGDLGSVVRAALNSMFTEIYAKLVAAAADADGYLTKEDWATFNGKQDALSAATALADGYLKKEDFSTFAAKQDALSAATAAVDGYLKKEDFATFAGKQDALSNGVPFRKTNTITAAAAGTAVHLLLDASVGAGKKAYITDILLYVNGETAWTDDTATVVKIQDTNGTAVLGASFAKAQLLGGAILGKHSAGVTLAASILTGTGFTAAKGLDIVADANFAAGSDIIVTVCGFIE